MLETAKTCRRNGQAAGGRLGMADVLAKPRAPRLLRQAEQFAALQMVDEARQLARLDHHEQHEVRPLLRRLPERGVALQRRIRRLQIFVRHDAEDVVGGVVALLHPAVDVAAALDLPFVDMRRVAERFQLRADPMRPLAVAVGIADEYIRHSPSPPKIDGAILASRPLQASPAPLGLRRRRLPTSGAATHRRERPYVLFSTGSRAQYLLCFTNYFYALYSIIVFIANLY